MFRPIQIVSAQRLEAQATSIADIIGLPLPPVNFYSSNYLKLLYNPNDKVLELLCLIQNWSIPSGLYYRRTSLVTRKRRNLNGLGLHPRGGRDWEDDLSLIKLSLNDDKLRNGNNPCVSHSRKSETESMDCDEPSLECVSSPDDHKEKSKECAIKRLITDMGYNLFCYIPPRVKVKRQDYLQCEEKKWWSIVICGSRRLLHSFTGLR
ncbi:hypothetical protein ARALYDRAFT_915725 [Arabidopsis lyrata subsp. lyrata]|uniref:Uncharacterized protein n=1 Tax=Arabidopsis lyrata subsp. lyrata TaxID=81972 RepID=D7MHX5_ARALL|nr:hypothetical protein ARALYDRAFT_915725 [Arabidopsis lyrata subsp. lyrata]